MPYFLMLLLKFKFQLLKIFNGYKAYLAKKHFNHSSDSYMCIVQIEFRIKSGTFIFPICIGLY